MVKHDDFEDICAKAAEAAYAALPDLGEQDQDKVWENVAKQIPCNINIAMNSPSENDNIKNLTFDDLLIYYKNAAVEQKFEDMIEEIKESDSYNLNLNDNDDSAFEKIMTSLCPAQAIEMTWSYEINESDGQFCINIEIQDSDIAEIANNLTLLSSLESAFAAKINAKYYQIAKCPNCDYMNLEAETPNHRAFYKNNTNYHDYCGYPKGILNYLQIVEQKSGSMDEQENQIAAEDIASQLKTSELWEELKEMYGLVDHE